MLVRNQPPRDGQAELASLAGYVATYPHEEVAEFRVKLSARRTTTRGPGSVDSVTSSDGNSVVENDTVMGNAVIPR